MIHVTGYWALGSCSTRNTPLMGVKVIPNGGLTSHRGYGIIETSPYGGPILVEIFYYKSDTDFIVKIDL